MIARPGDKKLAGNQTRLIKTGAGDGETGWIRLRRRHKSILDVSFVDFFARRFGDDKNGRGSGNRT